MRSKEHAGPADQGDGSNLEEQIADYLARTGWTAATAESLTGGNVSARLSALPGASDWYVGGLVAYDENVKYELLGVDPGPVITASAAAQMAAGVARLLKADVAVATTGVGGPGPQENQPQGTVFLAVATPRETTVAEYHFDGDPSAIVRQTTQQALQDLITAIMKIGTSTHT